MIEFQYWTVPEIWNPDTPTYILGGGSSMKGINFSSLKNKRCIGVNCSYLIGPWVDFCFFGDKKFYDWHIEHYKNLFLNYPGFVVTNCENLANLKTAKFVRVLKRIESGITYDKQSCAWNGNSGAAAINLACLLGSKKIILIGFDMKKSVKGEQNWHNLHVEKDKKMQYRRYIVKFQALAAVAKKNGIEILNANPDSELECFPKIKLEKAFEL